MGSGVSTARAKGRPLGSGPGCGPLRAGLEGKELSVAAEFHPQKPEGRAERDSDQDEGAGQMSPRLVGSQVWEGCGAEVGGGWGGAGLAQKPERLYHLASTAQHLGPGDEKPVAGQHTPAAGTAGTLPASGSCKATGHLIQRCPRVPLTLPGIPAHLSPSLPGPRSASVSAAPDPHPPAPQTPACSPQCPHVGSTPPHLPPCKAARNATLLPPLKTP